MRSVTKPPIDPNELKPLFYWAGLTLHGCQLLEYGVKVLLVTMGELGFGGFRLDEAISIIEDERKKTLGQVLRCIRERVTFSEGWASSLEEGLRSRNRFIHGFLSDSTERIVDPATRAQVITDIKAIRLTVLSADKSVRQILETLFVYAGLNWDNLNQQWTDEVRAIQQLPNNEGDVSQE